jgi:hypothetical protein
MKDRYRGAQSARPAGNGVNKPNVDLQHALAIVNEVQSPEVVHEITSEQLVHFVWLL